MTASGLHKLQVQEWWSGLAAWFYLHPPFHTTPEDVRGLRARTPRPICRS